MYRELRTKRKPITAPGIKLTSRQIVKCQTTMDALRIADSNEKHSKYRADIIATIPAELAGCCVRCPMR